jgi:hypothetical protein
MNIDPWNIIGWGIIVAFLIYASLMCYPYLKGAYILIRHEIKWYSQVNLRKAPPKVGDTWATPFRDDAVWIIRGVDPLIFSTREDGGNRHTSTLDNWNGVVTKFHLVKVANRD